MPGEVLIYITKYGYLAVFLMVFLQEIGFPNPVPNELLLIFSGYLTYKGMLSFFLLIPVVLAADLSGTFILFFLFRGAGQKILQKAPRWFPLSGDGFRNLQQKISSGGNLSIFLLRLTPFTRGYTSAISGLTGVKPGVYTRIAIPTAMIWAFGYITAGLFIAPFWDEFNKRTGDFRSILAGMFMITLIFILVAIISRLKNRTGKLTGEI